MGNKNLLKNVTLEVSLKPFKKTDDEYVAQVCREMLRQWSNLIKHSDMVSVLLWSSDGSEILEYKGDFNEEFDWARYIRLSRPVIILKQER